MIDSKDISVVVQGAINKKYIYNTLKSIRHHLPDAEIILSTWQGSDVSDLDYDILILNKDPGATVYHIDGRKQNQNRQILSTKNGIKKATRKYVLKIRSDMMLLGNNFLNYFGKYIKRNSKCKILKERVLVNSLYTRNSLMERPNGQIERYLFHPSDWIMFGLKEDMLNIWDIPLAPEPDTSQYFLTRPELPFCFGCLTRYHAEQYIWSSFLKKNKIKFKWENNQVFSTELMNLSELSIVNNLTLLEYKKEFDILCQKYQYRYGDSETMHPYEWLQLYKKYCDPDIELNGFKEYRSFKRLSVHWNIVKQPFNDIRHWFGDVLSVLWYVSIIGINKFILKEKNKKSRE